MWGWFPPDYIPSIDGIRWYRCSGCEVGWRAKPSDASKCWMCGAPADPTVGMPAMMTGGPEYRPPDDGSPYAFIMDP